MITVQQRPMASFSPIPSEGAGQVFEDLFNPTIRLRRGAATPYWLGDEALKILGLDSTLTPKSFLNLLKGRTPEGKAALFPGSDAPRTCAWHRLDTAPGSVSALWAIGGPEIQELMSDGHKAGVDSDLLSTMAGVTGYPWEFDAEETQHYLFACFPGCASTEQTPQLHTHVILINAELSFKDAPRPVSPESLKRIQSCAGVQHYFYHLAMDFRVHHGEFRVTNFGQPDYEIIGVPAELYQPSPGVRTNQNCLSKKPVLCAGGTATSREQLLECWRRQASDFGWGSNEATALARCVKRERLVLKAPKDYRSQAEVAQRRERIETMTDHLLRQQRARFYAKKAFKTGKTIDGAKRGYSL
jgi:conjugative relaxase-like TrwC/TraI family protein